MNISDLLTQDVAEGQPPSSQQNAGSSRLSTAASGDETGERPLTRAQKRQIELFLEQGSTPMSQSPRKSAKTSGQSDQRRNGPQSEPDLLNAYVTSALGARQEGGTTSMTSAQPVSDDTRADTTHRRPSATTTRQMTIDDAGSNDASQNATRPHDHDKGWEDLNHYGAGVYHEEPALEEWRRKSLFPHPRFPAADSEEGQSSDGDQSEDGKWPRK